MLSLIEYLLPTNNIQLILLHSNLMKNDNSSVCWQKSIPVDIYV